LDQGPIGAVKFGNSLKTEQYWNGGDCLGRMELKNRDTENQSRRVGKSQDLADDCCAVQSCCSWQRLETDQNTQALGVKTNQRTKERKENEIRPVLPVHARPNHEATKSKSKLGKIKASKK
jgi:hypothetical protein